MTASVISSKFIAISDLMRLKKQYGTALLVFPAMWSLFMASAGRPRVELVIIFLLGAFLMRSAGCVINDIADRRFDSGVTRTKERPLASGRLGLWAAAVVFFVLIALAFVLMVLTLNIFTVKLAAVGALLAVVYPFVKRVSHFPQVFLGAAFGWGAVMAWAAVHDSVSIVAILIFIANIFWSTAYDTIYALMDIEDDREVGVKSTAIFFGSRVYFAVGLSYILTFSILALAGHMAGLGIVYYATLAIVLVYVLKTVSALKPSPTRERAMRGFTSNVWVGGVVLSAIIVDMNFL